MLCEICKQNHANTFISKNINGVYSNIAVCNECFLKTNLSKFFINNDSYNEVNKSVEKQCENCKTTISQINKTGQLGCAKCYEAFKESLENTLKRIQLDTTHKGKSPKQKINNKKENNFEDKINSLREEINEAISTENYEKAAMLRDMIKSIEEENV